MAKVLVSIISEQTIPNILFINEFEDIDNYIFVSTASMEKQGRSRWIIETCNLSPNQWKTIIVQKDSLVSVKSELDKLSNNRKTEYIVNLTGGTKLMSIGVYNYFINKESQIFYIPGGQNIYRKIYPEVKFKEHEISNRIGVIEYLKGCGIGLGRNINNKNRLLKASDYTENFLQIFQNNNIDFEQICKLRDLRNSKIKKVQLRDIDGLTEFLKEINFETNDPKDIDKKEIEYLTGGWFEEYTYYLIKKQYNLSYDDIGININIFRGDVQNEFDVLYTNNNVLHVIECKTGLFDNKTNRTLFNDVLYKLAALRKDFGLYAKASIYTLSNLRDENNSIKSKYADRCKLMNVKLKDKIDFIS